MLPGPLARALDEMLRDPAMLRDPPDGATSRTRRVGVPSMVAPQWYDATLARLPPHPDNRAGGFVAVIRDLSSARSSSAMALYREGQFSAFFAMCPHPILLNDFDSGEILDANRAFRQMFALDPQQAPGASVRNILAQDDAWVIDTAVRQLRARQSFGPFEATLRRGDGRRLPAMVRGFMSVDPDGRRLVWAMIEDITEIRAKEAALLAEQRAADATRRRLVSAIEAIDDGFAIFDADDRLVVWNTAYTQVFAGIADLVRPGALYDDLLRAAIDRGIFGPAGVRDDDALGRRLARSLTDQWDGEDALADGRLIWVRERATPERETVGLYEDVTARRMADRRLQQVVEGGEVAVWDWDADTGLSAMNDKWRSLLGRGEEAVELPHLLAAMHHDDRPAAEEVERALFRDGAGDFDLLCRFRHAAGHWVWLLSRGRVLARRGDGTPRRISGVTLDVSARIEAEERVTRLIHGARVGTWEHDLQRGLSIVNDRWAEIVGHRAAALNPLDDRRWLEMLHPDDVGAMIERTQRAFAAGQWQLEWELRLRHREGHWVWVLSRGQVTEWDARGKPLRISGVHLDISAAKALEAALARERDTLARILETSVSGIIAIDAEGRVVIANAAATAVLGRRIAPMEDVTRLLVEAEVTDAAGRPIALEDLPLNPAAASREVQQDVRLILRWPDGTRRILSVNVARLAAPGTDIALIASLSDITDAALAEDRLRAAMAAAEAASRAKSDFLATMSHEMRTPLNGVLGMVEVMDQQIRDPDHRAMLDIIRDSGEHLLAVINDILDLAKIEAGHLTLAEGPIHVAELVERVAATHHLTAACKSIALVTSCAGRLREALRLGDEKRLIQILHNLIGNAVKFTETGEVRVDVDAASPRRLVIRVTDTGIGMTPAEMARVFEDFTQGQSGIARAYGGTGLGLGIVRRLARLMDGEITLSNAPRRGLVAEVDIALPILPGASARDLPGYAANLPPVTVLAAEDNATNRIILASLLKAIGVRAEIVASGDEVLRLWRPGVYAAVLLDIAMPGRDGVATLRALRETAAVLGVAPPQTIAVTANAMVHQVQEYRAQGFVEVVAKPLRPELLAEALWTCIGTAASTAPEGQTA